MKLVLQCAMCGTHHPVGTPVCTTCRASGVTQMRLMFECPTCGHLGINPVCEACPYIEPLELDDDLIIAEEVTDDTLSLEGVESAEDFEDLDFDLDIDLGEEDLEDEAVVIDLTEENADEDDSELDDVEFEDLDDDEDD